MTQQIMMATVDTGKRIILNSRSLCLHFIDQQRVSLRSQTIINYWICEDWIRQFARKAAIISNEEHHVQGS